MANPFKALQRFFKIKAVPKKDRIDGSKEKEIKPTNKEGRVVKLTSEVQKAWDWYFKNSDSPQTIKNRFDRYDDIDYMIYNDSIISFALELYSDEIAQADVQEKPVEVFAKKAVEKEIYRLLELWGIDQTYIRECGYNLVGFGDSFDIIDFNKKDGITEVSPIDVRDVSERYEFKYSEIAKMRKSKKSYLNRAPESISNFIDNLESDSSQASGNFTSYLLGFLLSDGSYLPPWGVNHYRLFSRKSEFWPYGRSMFINLIGPFRQLKTAKNLMALSRALAFPKEIYEIETSEEMSEVEQWEKVNEARQEFQNSGVTEQNKEDFSVNSQLWIPKGVLSYRSEKSDLRVEDIKDVELLRDDLIMGTRIPKGYLIVDRGGWGTSSQSLIQQSKPFGRAVFSVQSPILQNISHLIRMHFLMTGQFDGEHTEFQLALKFPVVEEASDRLRMKQDTLRLAGDIIDGVKNAMGLRNEEPPPEVVRAIFSKYSFLSDEDIENIVKGFAKEPNPDDESKFDEEKFNKRMDEDLIKEAYFQSAKSFRMKEGIKNNRHFFFSSDQSISKENWKVYSFMRKEKTLNKENKLEEES